MEDTTPQLKLTGNFWEQECLKIWIPQHSSSVKFVIAKSSAWKTLKHDLYRHTYTHLHTTWHSADMNLYTLTINQLNRGRIHVSTELSTKANIQLKRLQRTVNVPNCVRRCVYVCAVCVGGWLAFTLETKLLKSLLSGLGLHWSIPPSALPPQSSTPSISVSDAVWFKKVACCLSEREKGGQTGPR